MFPARYFAPRYWTASYWPSGGPPGGPARGGGTSHTKKRRRQKTRRWAEENQPFYFPEREPEPVSRERLTETVSRETLVRHFVEPLVAAAEDIRLETLAAVRGKRKIEQGVVEERAAAEASRRRALLEAEQTATELERLRLQLEDDAIILLLAA